MMAVANAPSLEHWLLASSYALSALGCDLPSRVGVPVSLCGRTVIVGLSIAASAFSTPFFEIASLFKRECCRVLNTRDLLIDKDNQQVQEACDATKKRISLALQTLEPLFDLPEGKAAYAALKNNREA